MSANVVRLPDGTEQDASSMICEGCKNSVADHKCIGQGRSIGPRKDPTTRPQCPHCNGAIHFSMPGGLQNTECIMRQYYLDIGVIVTPYDKLPVYGIDELGIAHAWAKKLATPISYGRMESAAGGRGTYAALRPSKRKLKLEAAKAGERIEDVAKSVVAEAEAIVGTLPKPASEPTTPAQRADRRRTAKGLARSERPAPTTPPVVDTDPADAANAAREKIKQDKEERRARRRALLAGFALH